MTTKRIFMCCGEASGDLLGGHLAQALFEREPNLSITGMGGTHMQAAGVELIEDLNRVGVLGGFELIKHAKNIYRVAKKIKQYLKQNKPDLLILIDYPGFHLNAIAPAAKKYGIPVLYYVSPQIWAWRYGRIHKIRRNVNHMAVLYRFEEALYQKEKVPVTFVGHPLKNSAQATLTQEECYSLFKLDPQKPIVALLPGSRKQEVEHLLPIILETKKLIQQTMPRVQFAMPIASTLGKDYFANKLPDDITLVENNTYNLLSIANTAITASGTATLEISLMNVPMLILYKLTTPTYWLARLRLIGKKVPQLGLCNIIAQETVAKEYLQHAAIPKDIAEETIKLLNDEAYRADIKQKLLRIKSELGEGDPAQNVAEVALTLLHS